MKYVSRLNSLAITAVITINLIGCMKADPSAKMESARRFLEKNETASAIIELKNALQASPDLAEARYMLGKALLLSGDPVGSEAELQKARAQGFQPDLVTPVLAASLLAQGQFSRVTGQRTSEPLSSASAVAELKTLVAIAWL